MFRMVSLGILLCFCFVTSLLLREHNQLADTRGNDLDQANHLFELTTRFNATDYFLDYGFCTTKSPKPFQCVRYANKYHREYSRLWGPPAPDTTGLFPRKVVDCAYHIALMHANSSPTGAIFTFMVTQTDCSSRTNIKGGAVFDAFGYSEQYLAKCFNIDHFNDSYTVKCQLDELNQGSSGAVAEISKLACMKLTVVLLYEHYDGLSEVLLEWSHLYPPARRVLSDDVQYCVASPALSQLDPSNALAAKMQHRVPSSVKWYSGVWFKKPLQDPKISLETINATRDFGSLTSHATAGANYYYNYVPASTTATYVYNMWMNATVSLPAQRNRSHVTIPATALLMPHTLADEYAFEPVLYTDNAGATRSRVVPNVKDLSMDKCAQNGYDLSLCRKLVTNAPAKRESKRLIQPPSFSASVDGYVDERYVLRNLTCDVYHSSLSNYTKVNGTSSVYLVSRKPPRTALRGSLRTMKQGLVPNMMYHFIGASHMRYNFDAVSEYHYGKQVLENVPRKHDALQITNLRYNFVANARHQSGYLTQLCTKLQQDMASANYSVSSSNHTFILQTGAWDLASPLRRALHDPAAGPQLLSVLERIFSGTLPCGRLRHVLWLTSVPHPMCFDDNHEDCEGARSYRTNAAIDALNTFYLDGLFKIVDATQGGTNMGANSVGLSIIDVFSMIKPRLIFSEDNEVNCLNHFTCRLSFKDGAYSDGSESVLVQTPGGAAVVKSILIALSVAGA